MDDERHLLGDPQEWGLHVNGRTTMHQRSQGFSLIELLIAVTLFIVLLVLGGPSLVAFLADSRVRTAGEAILNGVQQAQANAIKSNAATRLALDPTIGTGGWQILALDPQDNTVPAANPATPCGAVSGPKGLNPVQHFCAAEGASDAVIRPFPADARAITFDGFGRIQCNTQPDIITKCDGTSNLQWVGVANAAGTGRPLRVCITDQQAPAVAGSVPIASSQVKLCDPAVAATEPQACPTSCS